MPAIFADTVFALLPAIDSWIDSENDHSPLREKHIGNSTRCSHDRVFSARDSGAIITVFL